ncbi:hypothetical protein [uncultured Erythrobacter sp.]|uniref:hypothetical protein n=1 Tax=uncultured Erythrobacter sp. TaxID=263913 RepID=UPI0026147D9B|nr:hypothetical protein [uncultured Erythrobacter sp.]
MSAKRAILAGAGALALFFIASTALAEDGWPACRMTGEHNCPPQWLNIRLQQGDARITVTRSCRSDWTHRMGRNDARRTIRQWFEGDIAGAFGLLCVRLPSHADKVEIASLGGHCGEGDLEPLPHTFSLPGKGATLVRGARFGSSGIGSVTLPGCHARIGDAEIGSVAYGGIFLRFADGYGFGDSYADRYFYGVYDGFGTGNVHPFGTGLTAISQFNTYHYAIRITASGRDVRWRHEESDR